MQSGITMAFVLFMLFNKDCTYQSGSVVYIKMMHFLRHLYIIYWFCSGPIQPNPFFNASLGLLYNIFEYNKYVLLKLSFWIDFATKSFGQNGPWQFQFGTQPVGICQKILRVVVQNKTVQLSSIKKHFCVIWEKNFCFDILGPLLVISPGS